MIKYDKFFTLLKSREISTYMLRKNKLISESTLTRLRHGAPIDSRTIDRICRICNCQPGDFMEYVEDEQQKTQES